jgi:hypothetical protein
MEAIMTLFKQALLVSLALSIVMLAGYAAAQAPADATGTWTGTTTRGASTIRLDLKQEGKNVTGTLSGLGASDDGPVTGTVDGNTIKLSSKTGTAPTLTIKGDTITGLTTSMGAVTLKRAP